MEFIKGVPPDLVTLDVEMPEMDGLQTLNEIQAFNMSNPGIPDIGVIMVSAHTHKGADTTIQALENGAFDFVTKPESEAIGDSVEMLQGALCGQNTPVRPSKKRCRRRINRRATPRDYQAQNNQSAGC